MMIWDAIRRLSGANRQNKTMRTIDREYKRRGVLGSLRSRDLRMEQFEDRVLLSITPPSTLADLDSVVCEMDQYAYLSDSVSQAVYSVSNLSSYDEAQLETANLWVVGVDEQMNTSKLASSLGADYLAEAPYLENATIWEFSENASWVLVADTLQKIDGIDYFYPLVSFEVTTDAAPNDPLFPDQWHLENTGQTGGTPGVDANVVPAWDFVTGEGVVVGIIDQGMEYTHPDLAANYRADLSWDFNSDDDDPSPEDSDENHGTAVAGVCAAVGNNDLGVSGAAPNAELASLRLLGGWGGLTDYLVASTFSHENQEIDIYNNSWGHTTWLYKDGPMTLAAIEDGITNGRDGLGNIYVFSAGNDRYEGENVNWNTPKNLRSTIAIAALDDFGHYSDYSSPGAPVMISAYSSGDPPGTTTTDRTGDDGYNSAGSGDGDELSDTDYTSLFNGTSSAAPLASGVIALILEANPDLTYRDVQHVLVESAEMNDPTDYDWVQNGAGYWVNHNYGFGAVDAAAAVEVAANWENVSEERSADSGFVLLNETIPDDGSGTPVISTVTLDDSVEKIEWVEVTVDIAHEYPGDLEIVLISPDGTESRLAETTSYSWSFEGTYNFWTLTSCHHWGEASEGDWTIEVRDLSGGGEGMFNSWELTVYGTSESSGPVDPDPNANPVGPELVTVTPNEGDVITDGTVLDIAPLELKFLFNEHQIIDADTLDAIQIVRAGGDDVIGNANDVTVEYGWIGIGDRTNEVLVRFAETLPDDLYQITIIGDGSDGDTVLLNTNGGVFHEGEDLTITFSLDLGAQILSVVPQPTYHDANGYLQQSRDTIEIYFNNDELELESVTTPEFYQLFATQETATPKDDNASADEEEGATPISPISVTYDPAENKAVLTFEKDLEYLFEDLDDPGSYSLGAFRLRVGNMYREIPTTAMEGGVVGDTLGTATDVGTLGELELGASLIISSTIEPLPYDLRWPGAIDELGHRITLPDALLNETHFAAGYTAADDQYGTATIYYSFPIIYGELPNGSPAQNLITPDQKDRAREIFELFSTYCGVQFVEDTTGESGLIIATGDLNAIDPYAQAGVGDTLCLAQGGVLVMDNLEAWEDGYGQTWFQTAMHGIGLLLGLGYTTDLPESNVLSANADPFDPEAIAGDLDYYEVVAEDVFPGNHEIIHGQHVYRPDGTDVDLYKFSLDAAGTFSAEITAERLENMSMLDSVLTVYDSNGTMIARNDDYYSEDSYIELSLPAGDYFVAITSTGNTEFDADVAESGLGGLTQGDYELRLTYRPDRLEDGSGDIHMVDTTGTQFDGDADGVPGGVYNYWFNVQAEEDTLFVYKYEDADVDEGRIAINPSEPLGSLANPYRYIDDALAAAGPNTIVRILGNRDRTFDEQQILEVSVDPTSTAVGDFNGDGVMDIVASNEVDDSISIMIGKGNSSFWPDVLYDVGDQPGAVTVGDLNNDGYLDIVVVNQADNTISLLLNDGSGGFDMQMSRFSGANPSDVALGDVNGDGILDIVVTNQNDDNVGVLLSDEDEVYTDQIVYNVGDAPVSVALGDVDNDGTLDIITVNQNDDNISVLLNDGDGAFIEVSPGARPNVGSRPSSVAIEDLDGDGNRDVVVANENSNNISVLLGLGNGQFATQVTYDAGTAPSSIGVADLDQDGAPDIVTTNRGSDDVSIFFGLGDGTFEVATSYEVGDQPMGLTLADLDGDNRPDIVTANRGSFSAGGDTVSVLLARRDEAYMVGLDLYKNPLEDGSKMEIPKDVTVMIDAGAVFKFYNATIDVGSSTLHLDRSEGALQVLGTPELNVYFTSYHDKTLGSWETDQAAIDLTPYGGDWGGLVFRNNYDYDEGRTVLETEGIFLNYVNHAEIRYGGGSTLEVNGDQTIYSPIYLAEARPTISHNTILHAAGPGMSADPRSFADTKFQGVDYAANYDRVGPDIHGNLLFENSQNGIFIRIDTLAGKTLTELDVCARFDDLDIVHLVKENLKISGTPGGATYDGNTDDILTARLDARLTIDPGIIIKLDGSRIETEVSAQLIAEGTEAHPIILTAWADDSYGAGGTFDTNDDDKSVDADPVAGSWGGLYFAPSSTGSIDHAYIAYGGGETRIPGTFADFNTIEIHQATVRLTNSVLAHNTGVTAEDRLGWCSTEASVIFVRGAQPVIAGNVIRDNDVPAMSINANSLIATQLVDPGRSTGRIDAYEEYAGNYGPLVRGNHLSNNAINGMIVRGEVLTIDSVWDDTDIVHVVYDEIVVPNFHTYGGLRLQSTMDESLVVKLYGDEAGFTALGTPGDIEDRIGGTLQIVGTPGFPVVLTSLSDDTVGAGVDPWGNAQLDTDNANNTPYAGDWRSIKLEEYVNDRNVEVVIESEDAYGDSTDNDLPIHSQLLGGLATGEKSSDDNLRLGFDVHGYIRGDDSNDADVYSFRAEPGTEVWIDIDRTSQGLDSVVELIDADGNVIASSDNSPSEEANITQPTGIAYTMNRDVWDVEGDMYTTNVHDAGMRLVLPGAAGSAPLTYYVRVRSADADNDGSGDSSGGYQLQVRLREEQEIAGSTVRSSSIRYATDGIELLGLPTSSPLLTEATEIEGKVVTWDGAPASAICSVEGNKNNFSITANTIGPDLNDVWVVFVNGGVTGDVAAAAYNPAFNNGGTIIKVLMIAGDPNATTAATVVAAINAEGTFSAALTGYDGGTNDGSGLIRPLNTMLGLTSGGTLGGTETTYNDTFAMAEHLGNILDTNYAAIEVSGFLTSDSATGEYDIDWYSFDVDPEKMSDETGTNVWHLTFDIDYAEGMARADTVIYVFDSDGTLLYTSDNSNVDEDQADAQSGDGMTDLTRGSDGTGDPFIGPVAVLIPSATQATTYYVAVASKARFAAALGVYVESGEFVQPLLRREPVNSIVKIAEDNVGDANGDMVADTNASRTAGSPQYVLFPDIGLDEANAQIDDYQLKDVIMYVSTGTDVYAFNPFTGEYHYDLTGTDTGAHSPDTRSVLEGALGNTRYDDIIMRNDGKLYSFTTFPDNDANNGRYRQISTGDGSTLSDNDDGIVTYMIDPDDPEGVITDDLGVTFHAMIDVVEANTRYVYAIGTIGGDVDNQYMFKFDADGNVISFAGSEEALPTSYCPWKVITGATGVFTGLDFLDGTLYGVTDAGMLYPLNGEDYSYSTKPTNARVPDDKPPAWTADDNWEMDLSGVTPVDLNTIFGETEIAFTGMTIGPPNVELEAYSGTFFATAVSEDSTSLYAFQLRTIDPETGEAYEDGPQWTTAPVFVDGQSVIVLGRYNAMEDETYSISGATGIAFSTLDYNLWHITRSRYTDEGHKIYVARDGTRLEPSYPANGNYSFWFGLENSSTFKHPGVTNYTDDNSEVINTYDLPGGAHGTLTTEAFSLAGYETADSPYLYFDYYLETDGGIDTNVVTDSARVYISGDGGASWTLLATNIDTPDDVMRDSDDNTSSPPYYMKDGTGGWLQARINLGGYVGQDNLRLKFEFATAASTNVSAADSMYTGAYLRAVAGEELLDGDMFSLISDQSLTAVETIFEYDMGYSLKMPNSAGSAIEDGETLTITDDQGFTVTFEFDKDGEWEDGNTPIFISDADPSNEVARIIGQAFDIHYENSVSTVIGDRVYLCMMEVDMNGMPIRTAAPEKEVIWHGAVDVTQSAGAAIEIEGNAPGTANDPEVDTVLVQVDARMSASIVAYQTCWAIDGSYVDFYGTENTGTDADNDIFTSVKRNQDLIYVLRHQVGSPGKMAYADVLPGETPYASTEGDRGTQFFYNTQGQDNAYEGWYVDNLTIGFIERGEMVTNATANTVFGSLTPQQVMNAGYDTEGYYQLEVRLTTEYSAWNAMFQRTDNNKGFDTNDRHSEELTLLAPEAGDIFHLSTFTVSDGINTQTFRFLDPAQSYEDDESVIDIRFFEDYTDYQMALRIVSAINSADTIDVTATHVNVGDVYSSRILLNGATEVAGMEQLIYDNEGDYPTDVELVDLDGDGYPDAILTTNEYADSISVLPGPLTYQVGDRPSGLELADVNNDGTDDVVVSNAGDHTVSVLLGNGNGTFESQLVYEVGEEPSNVELIDLDADGRVDIITTNKKGGTISILYGNGDGTFKPPVSLPVGWAPESVAAADINGDGIGDIVVANSRDYTVTVYLSVYDTIYAAPVTYDVGRLPVDVEIADMDEDGTLDILTANRTDGTVSILLNNGDHTYAEAVDYEAGQEPVDLDVADVNLDEHLDVVVANYSANVVTYLRGRGRSTNTLSSTAASYSVGLCPTGVVIGDLDMDDYPDIITSNYLSHTATFLAAATAFKVPSNFGTGNSLHRKVEGDENEERAQGQVLISGNEILYAAGYGIKFDAGERDSWSHPGSAAPLVKVNQEELVPCVTIENNLIVSAGISGILFSGDANDANGGFVSDAAVPFGRIINNTIYGGAAPLELLEPGDLVLDPSDNDSTEPIELGFELDLYGTAYTEMHVNNNGSITFDQPFGDVPGDGIPGDLAMIAPFWADIDTRETGEVRVAHGTSANGNPVVQIDWVEVGYNARHADKTNTFTLYIEDDPAGDIVVFVYHDMQWTTGDSDPDAADGFGGQGAQIGFDSGDGVNYLNFARPTEIRDLEDLMEPGVYVWRLDSVTGVPVTGGGTGIEVVNNASPTILNNIVANLDVGISVDDTCPTTVLGSNAYQDNEQNTVGMAPSKSAVVLEPGEPLFVDPENNNFYLAPGSPVIDCSIDSLEDREFFKSVRHAVGISESPILAPEYDIYGQLRDDDPGANPSGVGSNVYKDIGAIDRVDFSSPMATLIDPMDNDPAGDDRDPGDNDVFIYDEDVTVFSILLSDTADGIGIDDHSVMPSTVQIFKNGSDTPLVEGYDYFFVYNDATDVITLIAGEGIWDDASEYIIVLDNGETGIRDIAGNPLRPNHGGSTTYFTVALTNVDYGDAPDFPGDADPDYPTTLANNGARHLLVGDYYLGSGVSGETDANFAVDPETGEYLKNATGDEMDDGIEFTSALLVGNEVTLNVEASASNGYLYGWIDLNGDGDFDDLGENVIVKERLTRGWSTLSFILPAESEVPYDFDYGETFFRFRYIGYDDADPSGPSGGVPLGPTGEAVTGEVEDYMVVLVDTLKDFGDAPEPYPTLLADNGAVHELTSSLYLGSAVDQELDGQPDAAARGDDLHGVVDNSGTEPVVIDDEDGVRFLDYLQPGTVVEVSVTASAAGYLNAWIDFNADGTWSPGEQIADGIFLSAGENIISFTVPSYATVGNTYARFRLSSDASLEPTGMAPDGEVEDYRVLITDDPRDYGDAPRTYSTVENSEPAVAHMVLSGKDNDIRLTAVVPGTEMNDVAIVIVNNHVYGNHALVDYDEDMKTLTIDVDPDETTAATVVAMINAELGTVFTAELSDLADEGNDGTGKLPMTGIVAITAHGQDGSGDEAAYHLLTSDLYLGDGVDAELDGQPSNDALGDDDADLDDEDGVVLPEKFIAGTTKTIDVKIHLGSNSEAYLYGWIDFNLDGMFTNDEQIIYGDAITAGDLDAQGMYSATVVIPVVALEGTTYARFRLSTDTDLSYGGVASDGEVEDYQVNVARGTGSISGWVFEDRDRNASHDYDEKGISGVIVYIDEITNGIFDWEDTDGSGNFEPGIDRAFEPYVISMEDDPTTYDIDETGYYEFEGLAGRTTPYTVRFDTKLFELWATTYPNQTVFFPDGSHGNEDHSYTIYLEEAESIENVDFGNYRKPSVSVESVNVVEGDSGYTEVEVVMQLVDSFGAPVEVLYETADGSATIADGDYVNGTGSVTFYSQENPTPTWTQHSLTSNASNDYDYGISGNYVAWEGYDGNDWEIFLFTGEYDVDDEPIVIQITDNDTDDHFASLFDTGTDVNLAWVGSDGNDLEVYLYNGTENPDGSPHIYQLTNNIYDDHDPQVSDSLVTWWADDGGGDAEIYVMELEYADAPSSHIVNLTNNTMDDRNPVLSGRNIAWTGERGYDDEIFVFDGENGDLSDPAYYITQVTFNSEADQAPQIDGRQVVWEGKVGTTYEIFLYNMNTGITTQITSDSYEDRYPQISGDNIVWQGHDGYSWNIYLYNTLAGYFESISDSYYYSYYNEVPQIAGNNVVWRGFDGYSWDVYYYDIEGDGEVSYITYDDAYDFNPQVSDSMVVWRSDDGEDFEIIVATRNEPVAYASVTLRVVGDEFIEGDETFYLLLEAADPDNAFVTTSQVGINILNDDGVLDFGDAPDPYYPTLMQNNGARHQIVEGIYLGSGIDTEEDGMPTAAANGDDLVTSDDEDGVQFPAAFAQGTTVGVVVTASTFGFIDGWIDFNADGDWDDEGEHVFNSQMVTAGANNLTVNVPADARIGETYSRFRFSTVGGLDYTGQAANGEVEDYRILIAQQPTTNNNVITLFGTDGDDLFEFFADATTLAVEINGARYEYPAYDESNPNSVHTILFDGGKGTDTVKFHGSSDDESVELWSDEGIFRGPVGNVATPHVAGENEYYRYFVDTTNVEQLNAEAGGGNDEAVLYDSVKDDSFTGEDGLLRMKTDSTIIMTALDYAYAKAVHQAGGADLVSFYGTAGDDEFNAGPGSGSMETSAGNVIEADGFSSIYAYGGGAGSVGDRANLQGSSGDDTLTAYPNQSTYVGSNYQIEVNNFRYVTAQAGSGGVDRANLFDSAGDDELIAYPEWVRLKGDDYQITANDFRYTSATASAGGKDSAKMFDSVGTDTFEAAPTYAKMIGANFQHAANHFDLVEADGSSGGNDVVRLNGSDGDDSVIAGVNTMSLTGDGYNIKASYFQHLVAFAGKGNDEVHFYGGDDDNTFFGSSIYSKLTTKTEGGSDRTFRAYGFDTVRVWGEGGNDKAELHDSTDLMDLFEADDTDGVAWAQLSNEDFLFWVTNFEEVNVYSSGNGERKDVNEDAVDYILNFFGDWKDL